MAVEAQRIDLEDSEICKMLDLLGRNGLRFRKVTLTRFHPAIKVQTEAL